MNNKKINLRIISLFVFVINISNCTQNSFAFNTSLPAAVQISTVPQGAIGADFMGFSYEKDILSTNFFNENNAPLVALFSKLGSGILRIGGNSVNTTTWHPSGTGLRHGQTAPSDLRRLSGFLKATGWKWKVIYGLNAVSSDPALSVQEASFVTRELKDQLQTFEIGNEPDVYSGTIKPKSYWRYNFWNDWNAYYSAIKGSVPNTIFSGPSTASVRDYISWTIGFAGNFPDIKAIPKVNPSKNNGGKIQQLTQHYYRGNGQLSTSTLDLLLTPDPLLPTMVRSLVKAAVDNNIRMGFRVTEANSFSQGGGLGVSNSFGACLWLIEFGFTLAQGGAQGVNFHGGGNSTGYTPIADDSAGKVVEVRPEYYGMLFFSRMGPGTLLTTNITNGPATLFAYTTKRNDGTLAVALINNSRTDVASVTLQWPSQITNATALVLTAPSLNSTTGVTWGGSSIGNDGSWSATSSMPVSISGVYSNVSVPIGSAILIEAH